MDAAARERLFAAARRYLAARPWELVGDSYLFGIHDRPRNKSGIGKVTDGPLVIRQIECTETLQITGQLNTNQVRVGAAF